MSVSVCFVAAAGLSLAACCCLLLLVLFFVFYWEYCTKTQKVKWDWDLFSNNVKQEEAESYWLLYSTVCVLSWVYGVLGVDTFFVVDNDWVSLLSSYHQSNQAASGKPARRKQQAASRRAFGRKRGSLHITVVERVEVEFGGESRPQWFALAF